MIFSPPLWVRSAYARQLRRFSQSFVVISVEQAEHKSCSVRMMTTRVHLHNLKGAAMDMMWLFATVMGALLLGGIIVYKKSV